MSTPNKIRRDGVKTGSLKRRERCISCEEEEDNEVRRRREEETCAVCCSSSSRKGSSTGIIASSGSLPLLLAPQLPLIQVARDQRDCNSYCDPGPGIRTTGRNSISSSGIVEAVGVATKSKVEMEDAGVMQGQQAEPQQVSGGQVRYFQALMERTNELQRRIDLLESRMPDWNWAEECETEKWTKWWRHTVWRVSGFIFYNFLLCLVSGVLSIYWQLMRSLFLHKSDNDRTNDRTNIALLILFVKIISWYCGRNIHTGKFLTWAIIIVDGLTTAFVYNTMMYSINMQTTIEIIYPLLITTPQIAIYTLILLRVGIRLTLRSRKLGVKRIPFVLTTIQSLFLLVLFFLRAGSKGDLVENRDLFLHGLAGTLCGMLITLGMACYVVSRLQDKLVRENVREVISMYSLARRVEVPGELMMMPQPCELDPGGIGVV